MVFRMAFFISMYSLAISNLHSIVSSNSIIMDFSSVFSKNFIVALPLQLFVMGPFVCFIFMKFIKNSQTNFVSTH